MFTLNIFRHENDLHGNHLETSVSYFNTYETIEEAIEKLNEEGYFTQYRTDEGQPLVFVEEDSHEYHSHEMADNGSDTYNTFTAEIDDTIERMKFKRYL